MILKLPIPLPAYFEAVNRDDFDAATACFAPTAQVHDESRDYHGFEEIRGWIAETGEKYHPRLEPVAFADQPEGGIVTVKVSGTFPGSPIELEYALTIVDGKIAKLCVE